MQSIQQSILKIQKQGTSEQNIKKKQQIPILKQKYKAKKKYAEKIIIKPDHKIK